jgi:hypothetical protein
MMAMMMMKTTCLDRVKIQTVSFFIDMVDFNEINVLIFTDGDIPVVEPGSPNDHATNRHHPTAPASAGNALRISATLVLSSLIVILFKQF